MESRHSPPLGGESGGGVPEAAPQPPPGRDQRETPAFQHRPLAAEASGKPAARLSLRNVSCGACQGRLALSWRLAPPASGPAKTPAGAALPTGCVEGRHGPANEAALAVPTRPSAPTRSGPVRSSRGLPAPQHPAGAGSAPSAAHGLAHGRVCCSRWMTARVAGLGPRGRPPSVRPFALPPAHHRAKAPAAAPKGLGAAEGAAG